MSYLIDTGILPRFLLRQDSNFAEIRRAVRLLKSSREKMYTTAQTIAEFWKFALVLAPRVASWV